jgi:hypothetical protein
VAVAFPSCMLCRRPQLDKYRGLLVRGRHICQDCERKIIGLDSGDPDYEYYKWGLKKIWYCPTNA